MTTSACPACGLPAVETESCPRCGVIVAKFRPRPAFARAPTGAAPPASSGRAWPLLALALALTMGLFFALGRRSGNAPPSAPLRAPGDVTQTAPSDGAADAETAPPSPSLPVAVQVDPPPAAAGMPSADRTEVEALVRLAGDAQARVSGSDLQRAEELLGRYPDQDGLRTLLAALHLRLAVQAQAARNYGAARQHARQAAAQPALARQALALVLSIELEAGDWPAAEAAARQTLAQAPGDLEGQRGLAYALFRQDRNREATQVLEALLATQPDAQAQALLERIKKQGQDERGMTEQRLAHFNVRYDGDEHEDVGREILRALERHYATLRTQLDHDVATAIPVILFSRQDYYQANGMPAWAGGHYDNTDGRIRVPIGGLSASLSPDLDGTLLHELTHAFVADRSRGVAPRELHEGLAQYMEGKRVSELLGREQLGVLADGGARGVGGFYLEALAFIEYLVRLRGLGGVNDSLAAMGASGNVDQAFQQVYGRDFAGARAEWRQRFRQAEGN